MNCFQDTHYLSLRKSSFFKKADGQSLGSGDPATYFAKNACQSSQFLSHTPNSVSARLPHTSACLTIGPDFGFTRGARQCNGQESRL